MSKIQNVCCSITSDINVNGIGLLQQATLGHFTGERHYAEGALKDGRRHVAKLTAHLDDLSAALAEEKTK